MSDDLRIRLAKSQLEMQQHGSRFQFPPKGASKLWQDAAAKAKEEAINTRCPIILGPDTVFETPKALQEFLDLPLEPAVGETVVTELMPPRKSPEESEKVRYCAVEIKHMDIVQNKTKGDDIYVWFDGFVRHAWVARSLRSEKELKELEIPEWPYCFKNEKE